LHNKNVHEGMNEVIKGDLRYKKVI